MGSEQASAKRTTLLRQIEMDWDAFAASYAGLSDAQLTEPAFAGGWSVQDFIAHITTWEAEALQHLPLIIAGGRPPRYAAEGGIDAFNARMTQQKRGLLLAETRQQQVETHQQLIAYIHGLPAEQLASGTRARRRLRLDTYSHYPLHTETIRQWRAQQPAL